MTRAEPIDTCDLAVIGAGAAGLAGAIFAAESATPGTRIVLLDGARRLGAKILIAGGGRCNVTHERVNAADFNGSRPRVRNVLNAFDAAAAVRWFASLGVALKREASGKIFPASDRARTVLDALVGRCSEVGVAIRTPCRVVAIEPPTPGAPRFVVRHAGGAIEACRVVLATGGRSVPKTGSDGSGYELSKALGHTVTPTWPALVPLVVAPSFFHAALAGISTDCELTTRVDGRIADRRRGSLLWTHFGISGPVVLDASRHWVGARAAGRQARLHASFVPGASFEDADRWLAQAGASHPRRGIANELAARLPERLAHVLVHHAGIAGESTLGRLGRDARRRLAHALTDLVLPVERDRGWNYAEVTAGGVPLEEVDFRTMESRIVPGLHLAGEILDCDGRIGGFNFQWAWATGFLAGRAAARKGDTPVFAAAPTRRARPPRSAPSL